MKSMKRTTLAAAITSALALVGSGQAMASVYAGASLEIQDLIINITGVTGGEITGYTFNLDNTATLNGAAATTVGISSTCNSLGLPACAPLPDSPLTAVAANAPGSAPLRIDGAANNWSFFGPGMGQTYANSDSEILTAQLVDGVPSSSIQIAEVEIAGTGTGQSSTTIQSNTQFSFTFDIGAGGGTFELDFEANPNLYVAVDTVNLLGAFAQANTGASFTLTGAGTSVQWSPDGLAGGFAACTGVTACVETDDEESLNNTVGLPGGNPDNAGISDARSGNDLGFSLFGIRIEGLQSGSYSFTLAGTASVNALQAVPEPGMLALLGIGLAGLGFMSRRRKI